MSTNGKRDWRAGKRVRLIVQQVEELLELAPGALKGESRMAQFVLGRSLAAYLARRCTGASYAEIGKYLNRHHSTILNAEARGEGLYRSGDSELRHWMQRIGQRVTGNTNWR